MERARDLRSCGRRGTGLWVSGTLLGALLLRTLARATRIHDAMLLRGFEVQKLTRVLDTLKGYCAVKVHQVRCA